MKLTEYFEDLKEKNKETRGRLFLKDGIVWDTNLEGELVNMGKWEEYKKKEPDGKFLAYDKHGFIFIRYNYHRKWRCPHTQTVMIENDEIIEECSFCGCQVKSLGPAKNNELGGINQNGRSN